MLAQPPRTGQQETPCAQVWSSITQLIQVGIRARMLSALEFEQCSKSLLRGLKFRELRSTSTSGNLSRVQPFLHGWRVLYAFSHYTLLVANGEYGRLTNVGRFAS